MKLNDLIPITIPYYIAASHLFPKITLACQRDVQHSPYDFVLMKITYFEVTYYAFF